MAGIWGDERGVSGGVYCCRVGVLGVASGENARAQVEEDCDNVPLVPRLAVPYGVVSTGVSRGKMIDYTSPYHSIEDNYGFVSLAEETSEEGRGPPEAAYTWEESMGLISSRYKEAAPERGIGGAGRDSRGLHRHRGPMRQWDL